MSRSLAATCAGVTSLLWLVALRYGAFQRRSQRLFQDALADTGQVAEEVTLLHAPAVSPLCSVVRLLSQRRLRGSRSDHDAARKRNVSYHQLHTMCPDPFRCRCSRCRARCARSARSGGRGRGTAAGSSG